MSTNILGISAFFHDSAAALLMDGELIGAVQEERFTRKKHDDTFPINAVKFCLERGGISLTDVDQIVFYDKPILKFERLIETYLKFAPKGYQSFKKSMPIWLKEKLFIKKTLRKEFAKISSDVNFKKKEILFASHHQSHAASAFYPSPFEKSAVLCIDGVGEWATTSGWFGEGVNIDQLWQIEFPHSLGLLYSAFTAYCGFQVNSGEYKLMGLAPYGRPLFVDKIFNELIDVKTDGSFRLNLSYFDFPVGLQMFNHKFCELFDGAARLPESKISQREMDIAASIQVVLEQVVVKLATTLKKQTGSRNLCMAGGVALNCVANGKIQKSNLFRDIWVQPAAGDAGGALGAAYFCHHSYNQCSRTPRIPDSMNGCLLGPEYTNLEINAYLDSVAGKSVVLTPEKLSKLVARRLADGDVIGWFQGRMEFGPRALGSRSILGDPRNGPMQSRMNLKIKFRESFRPFAPIIRESYANKYFKNIKNSRYMLFVYELQDEQRIDVTPEDDATFGIARLNVKRSTLPAITHVDYSARVQTLPENTNCLLDNVLEQFRKLTGHPALINTSFNVRGEPIVCTPQDAYECFMSTDMDCLVMGNHFLQKSEQKNSTVIPRPKSFFELD